MRERAISSVGVVLVGLVPALLGGPIFAATMAALCLVGYREFLTMAGLIGTRPIASGYLAVPAFAVVAVAGWDGQGALGVVALAVGLPLAIAVLRTGGQPDGTLVDWALGAAGSLYLGVPVAAAVAMRQTPGELDRAWLADLAEALSFDQAWGTHPRGLAWLLLVVLVTWIGDTGAYLVGRAVGRRPLLPSISPNKTVEGALGGLAGSALVGGIGVAAFGLGVSPLLGAVLGAVLGALGQMGDLAESMMKRQAGVKDSGTFIRGHGGVLDRVDALLIALTAGWYATTMLDRLVR
ncbi:MAG: Phosphatidate cytidylyltransferase [uncultured Thermomicrobiales bacterium]|uniref:Phosphatidate cytidylyltransferase n=1 Tax=uncultured Thermomicrobiales bacterium TaxID=1645740 RepID=A0A6J4U4E0_9BACT|nr:MAG: Phosphatidate cytidylyltransferase [uncultured Thermomicrobiales bacterium]